MAVAVASFNVDSQCASHQSLFNSQTPTTKIEDCDEISSPESCPEAESVDTCRDPETTQADVNSVLTETTDCEFKCSLCAYTTPVKRYFKRHLRKHSSNIITCPLCDYTSPVKYHMIRHLSSHITDGVFRCPLCTFSSPRADVFSNHMLHHSNLGSKSFHLTCDKCSYRTSSPSWLKSHMENHSNKKVFSCSECPYSTIRRGHYNRHINNHNKKNNKCPLCDFTSTHRYQMQKHTEEHKKPSDGIFSCDQCEYLTKKLSHFKRHLDTHKHECSLCNSSFASVHSLKEHIVTVHNDNVAVTASDLADALEKNSTDNCEVNISNSSVKSENEADLDEVKHIVKSLVNGGEVQLDQSNNISAIDNSELCNGGSNDSKSTMINGNKESISNRVDESKDIPKNSKNMNISDEGILHSTLKTESKEHSSPGSSNNKINAESSINNSGKRSLETDEEDEEQTSTPPRKKKNSDCNPKGKSSKFKNSSLYTKAGYGSNGKIGKFTCMLCKFATTTRKYLNRHLRRHSKAGNIRCPTCSQRAPSIEDLWHHVELHKVDSSDFSCDKCEFSTPINDEYILHMTTHNPVNILFPNKPYHTKADSPEENEVDKFNGSVGDLSKLGVASSKENSDASLTQENALEAFLSVHKDFSVEPINPAVSLPLDDNEQQAHALPFKISSPTLQSPEESVNDVNGVDDGSIAEDGGVDSLNIIKSLAMFADPKEENVTHADEGGTYPCDQCSYVAGRKDYLIRHLNQHSGKGMLYCPHCKYSTVRKEHMKRHVKLHFEGVLKCEQCEYTTRRKEQFRMHQNTHEAKEHLQCPHCYYISIKKEHMRRHVARHTNEKASKCPFCTYTSDRRERMRKHVNSFHNNLIEVDNGISWWRAKPQPNPEDTSGRMSPAEAGVTPPPPLYSNIEGGYLTIPDEEYAAAIDGAQQLVEGTDLSSFNYMDDPNIYDNEEDSFDPINYVDVCMEETSDDSDCEQEKQVRRKLALLLSNEAMAPAVITSNDCAPSDPVIVTISDDDEDEPKRDGSPALKLLDSYEDHPTETYQIKSSSSSLDDIHKTTVGKLNSEFFSVKNIVSSSSMDGNKNEGCSSQPLYTIEEVRHANKENDLLTSMKNNHIREDAPLVTISKCYRDDNDESIDENEDDDPPLVTIMPTNSGSSTADITQINPDRLTLTSDATDQSYVLPLIRMLKAAAESRSLESVSSTLGASEEAIQAEEFKRRAKHAQAMAQQLFLEKQQEFLKAEMIRLLQGATAADITEVKEKLLVYQFMLRHAQMLLEAANNELEESKDPVTRPPPPLKSKLHVPKQPELFSCHLCSFTATWNEELNFHMESKHCFAQDNNGDGVTKRSRDGKIGKSSKTMVCNTCRYYTSRPYHMRRHIERKHKAQPVTDYTILNESVKEPIPSVIDCNEEDERSNSADSNRVDENEMETSDNEESNDKNNCDGPLETKGFGMDYLSTTTNGSVGSNTFQDLSLLDFHRNDMTRAGSSDCSTPDSSVSPPQTPFSLPSHLQVLLRGIPQDTVKKEKPLHTCPFCNFTTIWKEAMKKHIQRHTDPSKGFLYCSMCKYKTYRKDHMNSHMMQHTGEGVHRCPGCTYRTGRKDHMKRHLLTCKGMHKTSSTASALGEAEARVSNNTSESFSSAAEQSTSPPPASPPPSVGGLSGLLANDSDEGSGSMKS